MKIIMSKRKSGIYAQWFEIFGINDKGEKCWFLIYYNQAKNYAQAIRFYNKNWGKRYQAIFLRNAEPIDEKFAMAC